MLNASVRSIFLLIQKKKKNKTKRISLLHEIAFEILNAIVCNQSAVVFIFFRRIEVMLFVWKPIYNWWIEADLNLVIPQVNEAAISPRS